MPDVVRQPGARLTGEVDPRLAKRFYPSPLANLRRSYGAFHAFDKTHTVALAEAGLIRREAARSILAGLREMKAQGIEAVRDSMGGGRHSGEAYLTGKLGAGIAGWINLGRSSGDLDAVAWRYSLRQRLPALDELEDMVALLADMVATMHVDEAHLLEATRRGWTQATDLAAMLTRESGISWRDAHQILARLVREAIDAGKGQEDVTPADIDRAAQSLLGRPLVVTLEAIRSAVDPRLSVKNRQVVDGSPAPAEVEAQIRAARLAVATDAASIESLVAKQRDSAARLEVAIDAVLASEGSAR